MEKQTKNVITRESIEKDLWFYNTADIRSTLVVSGAAALVCVPLIAMMVYISCEIFSSVWLEVVFSVLLGGLMGTPMWINLFSLIKSLKERKLLKNREFDIVVCKLEYKYETYVRQFSHRGVENRFNFDGFKDKAVGRVNFNTASPGDEFYVVYYKGHSNIESIYPMKTYELKEK